MPGHDYFVGGVRFDSFAPGIGLIEGKHEYGQFFDAAGNMYPWFRTNGYQDMISQAARQVAVAGDVPVVWYVHTPQLAAQLRIDFDALGLDIQIRQ